MNGERLGKYMAGYNNRLVEVIRCKEAGSQAKFSEKVGWSHQYTNKLIHTEGSFGIRPLLAILDLYPDISERWLLMGEGEMLKSMHSPAWPEMQAIIEQKDKQISRLLGMLEQKIQ